MISNVLHVGLLLLFSVFSATSLHAGYLGVDLKEIAGGLEVTKVDKSSPADIHGLCVGDKILGTTWEQFISKVRGLPEGGLLKLNVLRKTGQKSYIIPLTRLRQKLHEAESTEDHSAASGRSQNAKIKAVSEQPLEIVREVHPVIQKQPGEFMDVSGDAKTAVTRAGQIYDLRTGLLIRKCLRGGYFWNGKKDRLIIFEPDKRLISLLDTFGGGTSPLIENIDVEPSCYSARGNKLFFIRGNRVEEYDLNTRKNRILPVEVFDAPGTQTELVLNRTGGLGFVELEIHDVGPISVRSFSDCSGGRPKKYFADEAVRRLTEFMGFRFGQTDGLVLTQSQVVDDWRRGDDRCGTNILRIGDYETTLEYTLGKLKRPGWIAGKGFLGHEQNARLTIIEFPDGAGSGYSGLASTSSGSTLLLWSDAAASLDHLVNQARSVGSPQMGSLVTVVPVGSFRQENLALDGKFTWSAVISQTAESAFMVVTDTHDPAWLRFNGSPALLTKVMGYNLRDRTVSESEKTAWIQPYFRFENIWALDHVRLGRGVCIENSSESYTHGTAIWRVEGKHVSKIKDPENSSIVLFEPTSPESAGVRRHAKTDDWVEWKPSLSMGKSSVVWKTGSGKIRHGFEVAGAVEGVYPLNDNLSLFWRPAEIVMVDHVKGKSVSAISARALSEPQICRGASSAYILEENSGSSWILVGEKGGAMAKTVDGRTRSSPL